MTGTILLYNLPTEIMKCFTYKFLVFPCLLASSFLFAQHQNASAPPRPFKVDFMMAGFTQPLLNNVQEGYVYAIEPKYVTRSGRWELGARFERANINHKEVRYLKSTGITADWFVNERKLRPFFGMGLSSFVTSNIGSGNTKHWYTPAGVTWRTGIEYWHFRTSVEANILNKSSLLFIDYIAVKFGGTISFGKRKKP
jgi:hypothetical protein